MYVYNLRGNLIFSYLKPAKYYSQDSFQKEILISSVLVFAMSGIRVNLQQIRQSFSHPVYKHYSRRIYKRYCSIACDEPQESKPNADDIKSRILYNEVLTKEVKKVKPVHNEPIFLKYLEEHTKEENIKPAISTDNKPDVVHFPYQVTTQYLKNIKYTSTEVFEGTVNHFTPSDNLNRECLHTDFSKANLEFEDPKRWCLDKNDGVVNDNIEDEIKFGTSDPKTPVSKVPCGGCGALLQCNSPSIPGFLPQEVFKGKNEKELMSEICQRCHFLNEFDVALGVNVSPTEYLKIISQIKDKKALALVMVDMTDFPCSINPGVFKLLGSKSFFVVGNKVDLFIREGTWLLTQLEKSLSDCLEERGVNMKNILHIGFISAKTGFGIEELINKLHKLWAVKGDVYIIGCTNAGKSTLFNTLINSDYCKVQASNIMHRATISAWPGTTLNLLKFPLTSPSGWKLFARTMRLQSQKRSKDGKAYEKLLKNINLRLEQIPLSANINRTNFRRTENTEVAENNFETDMMNETKVPGIDPKEHPFDLSKWCYDTPGVVFEDQIINLLTTPELLLTVPSKMLIPRNFRLKLGTSLFIGGLARLDFVEGPSVAWFTVYASRELPITLTNTEDASYIYKELLGSDYFRVPLGGEERLKKWPALSSKKLKLTSKNSSEAAGDVVLSNAGWVSVVMPSAYRCILEAWTPERRGIHLREIPVIKNGHTFRGSKIRGTPAFRSVMKEIPQSRISKYLEYVKIGMEKS